MKKELKIYILRHGEKEIGEDPVLTKRGIKQVKKLSKRLSKLKISKVYSSDLKRCGQTAKIISKKIKLPINYSEDLREVPSKVKEYPKKHKKEINKLKKFWMQIIKQNGNILLISSGIVNRILTSFALNIIPSKANFMQYPTGLTKLKWNNERRRFKTEYINDTSHLNEKLRKAQKD